MNRKQQHKRHRAWAAADFAKGRIDRETYGNVLSGIATYQHRQMIVQLVVDWRNCVVLRKKHICLN